MFFTSILFVLFNCIHGTGAKFLLAIMKGLGPHNANYQYIRDKDDSINMKWAIDNQGEYGDRFADADEEQVLIDKKNLFDQGLSRDLWKVRMRSWFVGVFQWLVFFFYRYPFASPRVVDAVNKKEPRSGFTTVFHVKKNFEDYIRLDSCHLPTFYPHFNLATRADKDKDPHTRLSLAEFEIINKFAILMSWILWLAPWAYLVDFILRFSDKWLPQSIYLLDGSTFLFKVEVDDLWWKLSVDCAMIMLSWYLNRWTASFLSDRWERFGKDCYPYLGEIVGSLIGGMVGSIFHDFILDVFYNI